MKVGRADALQKLGAPLKARRDLDAAFTAAPQQQTRTRAARTRTTARPPPAMPALRSTIERLDQPSSYATAKVRLST